MNREALPIDRIIISMNRIEQSVVLAVLMLSCSIAHANNWSQTGGTYLGGSSNIGAVMAIARDSAGYVYGVALGSDLPTTGGCYQSTKHGLQDLYVFKMDARLNQIVWATYFGGSNSLYNDVLFNVVREESSFSIQVTQSNEVVIVGTTHSQDLPITSGVNVCSKYEYDTAAVFVAKFNSSGSGVVFSKTIGYTINNISPYRAGLFPTCALDKAGNIFIVTNAMNLHVNDPMFVTTSNAYQLVRKSSNNSDIALTVLDPFGNTTYCSYFGGHNRYEAYSLFVANSHIYMAGYCNSDDFPTVGAVNAYFIARWTFQNGGYQPDRYYIFPATEQNAEIDYNSHDSTICALSYSSATFMYDISMDLSTTIRKQSISGGVSGCKSLYVGGDGTRYLGTNSGIIIYDDQLQQLAATNGKSSIAGPTYLESHSAYTPRVFGSGCDKNLILCGRVYDNNAYCHSTAYQTQRLNPVGTVQSCLAIYEESQSNAIRIESGPNCGDIRYISQYTPCRPITIKANYGDGNTVQASSDTLVHHYASNGVYTLTFQVLNYRGDTVEIDTIVHIVSYPSTVASPHTVYRCSKDTGQVLHATGATRYVWHPSTGLSDSTSANPLAKPTQNMKYYVRGFDPSGCYADDSVQVYVTNIKASLSTYDTTVCAGSSVKLTAAGAAEFHWSPKAGLSDTNKATVTATPSQTTRYQVIVSEAGCPDTAYVTIHIAHKPQIQLSPSPIVCTGGSARLSVVCTSKDSLDSLGLHYSWTPSASLDNATSATPTATPLKTTRYTCTVSNKFGCVAVDSVEVKVQASLDLSLSPDTLTCKGSTLLLKASGGASYSWSPKDGLNDSTSATPLCTPTHDITYTVMTWSGDFHTATCRDTATMQVHVYDFPKVSLSGGNITVCKNTSVTLTCSYDSSTAKQASITWHSADGSIIGSGSSIEVSPDTSSKYFVTISNDQGCSSSDSTVVTVANSLSVKANAVATVLPGSAVKLSVQNPQTGTSYTWFDATHTQIASTDTTTLTVAQTTWFYVHAQRGGCEGWDSVLVTVSNIIDVQAGADQAVCRGQSVTLSVTNPQTNTTYTWTCTSTSWTASGVSVSLVPDSSRSYVVTATQGSNASRDTVLVTVYELPSFTLQDTTVCVGKTVTLQATDTDPSDTFIWKDATSATVSTSSSYVTTANAAATYSVTATTKHGCTSTKQLNLGVNPKSSLSFSISPIDSLFPGTVASYRVYVTASTSLSQVHIRASFSVADELLSFDNSSDISGQRVRVIDIVMDVSTTQQVLAIIPVRALISQGHSGAIQIVNISSNLDPECTDYTSTPQMLTIGSVCGNSLMKIRLVDQMLDIVPNPSGGDLTIHSSDPVQIFDAVGHSIQPDDVVHGDTEELSTLHNLGSGVYFVQMRGVGGVVVKKMVVWR